MTLRVLWGGPPERKNAASCAIEISGKFGRIWIMGDLPREQQWALARAEGIPRLVGLVAAHHGAIDGFSLDIARRQSPEWVIFSQSDHGRWQHPDPRVQSQWRALGAETFRTGQWGTLRVDLSGDVAVVTRPARPSPWQAVLDLRAR